MKFGLFQTPFTRPERSPRQVFDWAVDQAIAADQAGLEEFWVGQHFTLAWEAGEWLLDHISSWEWTIPGGTSEIQRTIIGERGLGLPREPR